MKKRGKGGERKEMRKKRRKKGKKRVWVGTCVMTGVWYNDHRDRFRLVYTGFIQGHSITAGARKKCRPKTSCMSDVHLFSPNLYKQAFLAIERHRWACLESWYHHRWILNVMLLWSFSGTLHYLTLSSYTLLRGPKSIPVVWIASIFPKMVCRLWVCRSSNQPSSTNLLSITPNRLH